MTFVGNTTPVALAPLLDRDDSGRWTTTLRWRGLRDGLVDIAAGLTGRARITQEDAFWHLLEVSAAGLINGGPEPTPDEQIVTVYELDYSAGVKKLMARPDIAAEFAKIPDLANRAQFRSDLLALCNGERVVIKTNEGGRAVQSELKLADLLSVASVAGMNADLVNGLVQALIEGVEDFEFEAPAVKVQRVAPPGSSIRANFGGLNRYGTTAALLGKYPEMPLILRENINTQLSAGFWKILSPRVKTQDATRVVIEEAYEFTPDYSRFTYLEPLTSLL